MAHLKDLIVNGASRFIGKAYGAFVGSFSGNLDGNATTSTTANIAKACSGNSATATTASKVYGIYTANGGQQGPGYFGTNSAGCLMSNQPINGHDEYKNWLYMDNYDGSDVGGATAIGISRTETRAYIMSSNADRKQWDRSAELLSSANYNSFAPTKTGGGASGTWGINISGNAVNDGNGANIANTYLKKSGGNMTGPLTFANGTWNLVGDDSYIGDHNISGTFCIKGANGITGIALFDKNNENDYAQISFAGGDTINFNKKLRAYLEGDAERAFNIPTSDVGGNIWIA